MSTPNAPGPRIFVSHSHADDVFGVRLVGDLRAAFGDDAVWYDSSGGLRGGDAWWSVVRRELRGRPIFLIILSPEAMASSWVNSEIDLAWKQRNSPAGKAIIPVLIAPCALRDDLDTIEPIAFVPPTDYHAALAELVETLRTAPAHLRDARFRVRVGASATPPPRRTISPRPGRLAAAASGLLLLALAISLLIAKRPGLSATASTPPATQTARAFVATETAQASFTPVLAASEAAAYHTNTPGPCDHQALWSSQADPNILTYACRPAGLALTAQGLDTTSASGGFNYNGHGGTFPAHYSVSLDVRDLTATGCAELTMDYSTNSAADNYRFDEFDIQACYDGTGVIQYSGNRPEVMLFEGSFGRLGDHFTIGFTYTGSHISVSVGTAPAFAAPAPAPRLITPLSFVALNFGAAPHTTASAIFTNFQFTPLP